MKYFVVDENKNLVEALSKEDVYSILEQAIEDGDLSHIEEDSAFVSKLKEANSNNTVHIWLGTMAEFNAIATKDPNTLYILTDDDSADSWDRIAEQVQTNKDDIEDLSDNVRTMAKLKKATFTNFYDLAMKLYSIINLNKSNYSNIIQVNFKFDSNVIAAATENYNVYGSMIITNTNTNHSITTSQQALFFEYDKPYNLQFIGIDAQGFMHFATNGLISRPENIHVRILTNTSTQKATMFCESSQFLFNGVDGFQFIGKDSVSDFSSDNYSGEFSVLYYEKEE